ncbi:hypothetical protein ACFY00_09095 [Kitasatospora sp. NPDC001540]|uniref:hypothetical protein n=1 Tax=Kitasatospora sp. NPDC001540 TaxID=3364014 RepID=UPI0036AA62FF
MGSGPSAGSTGAQALARWAALPAEVRGRIDGELLRGRFVHALGLLRDADGSGVREGRELLEERHRQLRPTPPDPLADAEALTGRVAAADGPVLGVVAARSAAGVELLVTGADGSRVLTVVDAATAARHLVPGEPADGRPPAEAAAEWLGRQVAAALGVPFRSCAEQP